MRTIDQVLKDVLTKEVGEYQWDEEVLEYNTIKIAMREYALEILSEVREYGEEAGRDTIVKVKWIHEIEKMIKAQTI